jgi:hypothetical protein
MRLLYAKTTSRYEHLFWLNVMALLSLPIRGKFRNEHFVMQRIYNICFVQSSVIFSLFLYYSSIRSRSISHRSGGVKNTFGVSKHIIIISFSNNLYLYSTILLMVE